MAELQVLIAVYGNDGIERVVAASHPRYPGVEYIINWQNHGFSPVPEEIAERADFKVVYDDSIGLCNARNNLLRHSSAEWVLISDDDVSYRQEHLSRLLGVLEECRDYAFLTFQYETSISTKIYPTLPFDFPKAPKGYFPSSIEIVLHRRTLEILLHTLNYRLFNPNFGLNGNLFCCGEEDVLLACLTKKGFKGRYLPTSIGIHQNDTTSERIFNNREFVESKGAVMLYLKPLSWPLRMTTHAMRASKGGSGIKLNPFVYCRWWLSGVSKAIKHNVFK